MIFYLKKIVLLFGVALLASCAATKPVFEVNIDSIGNIKENKTYILLPSNKDTKAGDLQFKEYATYVNRALSKNGFVQAKNFQEANVAIFLSYGIGAPEKHKYTYSKPIYGQTGVSSSTTNTNSNAYGSLNAYSNYGTYSGNTNTNSTTTYTPKYGVVGSTTHSASYTTYSRFMILDAVDLNEYRKSKKQVQLWKTTVTSTGSSGDLRQVLPILVAASSNYIATSTGKKILIKLLEESPSVLEIKGIVNIEK